MAVGETARAAMHRGVLDWQAGEAVEGKVSVRDAGQGAYQGGGWVVQE